MQEGNWVLMQMMMMIMMVVVVAADRKEVRSEATHVNEIAQLITSIQSNKIAFPMSNDAHSNGVMYLASAVLSSWTVILIFI